MGLSFLDCLRIGFGIVLSLSILAGAIRVTSMDWSREPTPRVRAREVTAPTALSPSQERVLDPESFWDSALYSLSSAMRAEFDPQPENISLTIENRPTGRF